MPIGVVNDREFQLELSKTNSVNVIKPNISIHPDSSNVSISDAPELINSAQIVNSPEKGRGTNNLEVPESLRKVIGDTSIVDGRASALKLAEQFGISPSSVSAYSNGATSTASYDDSNTSVGEHITKTKERISKRAQIKLMNALGQMTKDKFINAKLRDLSGVAKDMSGIIKDMSPESVGDTSNKPQFVFYSPQFKKEEHFETIIINE